MAMQEAKDISVGVTLTPNPNMIMQQALMAGTIGCHTRVREAAAAAGCHIRALSY